MGGEGGSSLFPLLLLAGLFLVMYVLVLRPQTKRRREMQQMQQSLAPGVKVVTIGGLYGTVVSTDDDSVVLEVAPGVTNIYAKAAIGRLIEPGTNLDAGSSDDSADTTEDDSAAGGDTGEDAPPTSGGSGKTLR